MKATHVLLLSLLASPCVAAFKSPKDTPLQNAAQNARNSLEKGANKAEDAANTAIHKGRRFMRGPAKDALNTSIDKVEALADTAVNKIKHIKPEDVRNAGKSVVEQVDQAVAPPAGERWKHNVRIFSYFALWYTLNVGYNFYNKSALNLISAPLTLSALQMLVGVVYVVPLWLLRLRAAPSMSTDNLKTLMPIGLCHAASHLSAVIGLGAGSVSFTHIIKAAEPAFTALFSALFLKQYFPLPVYLTLLPVIGGVAYASLQELDFKPLALAGAMGSNIAAASRAVLAKKSMDRPKGQNMGAANLYAVLTIIATAILVPLAAILEGSSLQSKWDKALLSGSTAKAIAKNSVLSGLCFYLYNEVAFLALDAVHPVTHAVGNTLKRVFVIVSSVILFNKPLTNQGIAGSSVAIIGVLIYSLVKESYSKKKAFY